MCQWRLMHSAPFSLPGAFWRMQLEARVRIKPYRSQTTVENCIGGVLSDYKKILPLKILKFFTATAIISLTY